MRTFLRRLCQNSALADELAQEAFLKAFRSGDALSDIENMRGWLLRIAYRCFLDNNRRETRRRDLARGEPDRPQFHPASGAVRLDIERAMNALPPERRACAMLCLALGHSHTEASGITGLPIGTVKSHVARAKSALQKGLSAYEGQTG